MKTTYIHEINSIACSNGELYLSSNKTTLIFNTDSLYKDLHIIVDLVIKENSKSQKIYAEQLKETLKQLK
jgi:hypothetical protein